MFEIFISQKWEHSTVFEIDSKYVFQTWHPLLKHLFSKKKEKKRLDQIQLKCKRVSGFINSLYTALGLLKTTTQNKMRCKYKSAKTLPQ